MTIENQFNFDNIEQLDEEEFVGSKEDQIKHRAKFLGQKTQSVQGETPKKVPSKN